MQETQVRIQQVIRQIVLQRIILRTIQKIRVRTKPAMHRQKMQEMQMIKTV